MPEDLDFIFADVDDILATWQPIHLDTEFDPYYPDIDDIALESGNITYDDRQPRPLHPPTRGVDWAFQPKPEKAFHKALPKPPALTRWLLGLQPKPALTEVP